MRVVGIDVVAHPDRMAVTESVKAAVFNISDYPQRIVIIELKMCGELASNLKTFDRIPSDLQHGGDTFIPDKVTGANSNEIRT